MYQVLFSLIYCFPRASQNLKLCSFTKMYRSRITLMLFFSLTGLQCSFACWRINRETRMLSENRWALNLFLHPVLSCPVPVCSFQLLSHHYKAKLFHTKSDFSYFFCLGWLDNDTFVFGDGKYPFLKYKIKFSLI